MEKDEKEPEREIQDNVHMIFLYAMLESRRKSRIVIRKCRLRGQTTQVQANIDNLLAVQTWASTLTSLNVSSFLLHRNHEAVLNSKGLLRGFNEANM